MADGPHTNLQALFPGLQKEAIVKTCNTLNLLVTSGGLDDLRELLPHFWFSVNHLLQRDRTLKRPLASLDDFNNNVNIRGEDNIHRLLRATAEDVRASGAVTRWANVFRDGAPFSFPLKCSGHFLSRCVLQGRREPSAVCHPSINKWCVTMLRLCYVW